MSVYTLVDYVKELESCLLDAGKQLPLMRNDLVHLIDGRLDDKSEEIEKD
ncbi:hypothetical protein [Bacillus massiliigorillae]|nr:hypothetical protein [Bacillus massiliigorillae]